MVKIVDYEDSHLLNFVPQAAQAEEFPSAIEWLAEHKEEPRFTLMDDDKILGFLGYFKRAEKIIIWSILAGNIKKKKAFAITGAIRKWLDKFKGKTVEAIVKRGFCEGERALHILGFEACGEKGNWLIYRRAE